MSGNEAHVKSFRTDVIEDRCAPVAPVSRCVSTADSSLSLSLSLSAPDLLGPEPSFSAEKGALLAGLRRAPGRGICHVWRRPLAVSPCADVRVDISLVRPPHTPWRAFEEVPSRAPTRDGSVGPMRRGLSHAWPRRPLFSSRPAGVCSSSAGPGGFLSAGPTSRAYPPRENPDLLGRVGGRSPGVCSSVVGPSPTGSWRSRRLRRVLQHAPVVVASAERRDLVDPGSRRSPTSPRLAGGGC
jgi:hypothetical protein